MSKILRLISGGLLLIVLLLLVAALWWRYQSSPVNADTTTTTQFEIPKGQAISVIAQRLADDEIIRQPLVFRLELKRLDLERKLQAGSFELSPSMSVTEVAQTLTQGTNDEWLTLLEGWRREEIAESIERMELDQFDKEAFLELSAASEGKLFPDTYLVPKQATADQLYHLFISTFDRKVTEGLAKEIAASEHEFEEALIMASLIEREARGLTQMKEVSAILWNRQRIGMPLQVDATLQYARGYSSSQQNWWVEPTAVDRQLDSPFNTYQHPGLPPRPISNPGLDAIKAALSPNQSDNLFYIHDREGNVHYAETLEEHNANINRYLRS